jgi:succinate dehydrogenase / fumarate reductase cytochrome b subunit
MSALQATSLNSSIIKKQIVALTGLLQGLFILGHLAGNFLIYAGPEAFNGYAEFLASQGKILWFVRGGLLLCFLVHVFFAVQVYLENRSARGGQKYAVAATHGKTTFAKKTMILSGLLVFFFLWLHLVDFTFGEKTGPVTVVTGAADGDTLGLFGLVWNSFLFNEYWWRPLIYILVVCFLGMHLSHGVQSIFQTYGFSHDRITPWIQRLSMILGIVIALAYSSIPAYVNILQTPGV